MVADWPGHSVSEQCPGDSAFRSREGRFLNSIFRVAAAHRGRYRRRDRGCHVRLLAAQSMVMAEVPVHVARDLTPSQVKAYRLMDNRSHDEATWDLDLIGPELQSIQELDSDFDLALPGSIRMS